jgi:hypothetical protein
MYNLSIKKNMKNLFILPTDKEPVKGDLLLRHIFKNDSKLECKSWWRYNNTITIDGVTQYTTLNGSFRDITSSFKTQNIYITSDEEIKEGDWVFDTFKNACPVIRQLKTEEEVLEVQKTERKIILTTDQDLIADGVQSIDDDFLEWFVKNPSCEKVEVGKTNKLIDNYAEKDEDRWEVKYHIYTPKEAKEIENQQQGYSEEDMKEAFRVGFNVGCNAVESLTNEIAEEWFKNGLKKFKNK